MPVVLMNDEGAIESRLYASAARLADDYRTSFERKDSDLPGMIPPSLFDEILAGFIVAISIPSAPGIDRRFPDAGLRELEDASKIALTLIGRWGNEFSSEAAAWELAIVASAPAFGRRLGDT